MVQLSCGVQCTRATLFALNILFLLLGFTVMGVGIYIKVNGNFNAISDVYSVSQSLGGGAMQWVGISMIITGVFTACLAAFGCLGALCHSRVFLYLYSLLLSLIIILEFGVVVVTLVYRNDLWQGYDSSLQEVFHHAYSQNNTDVIQIIENVETQFECCGVDGASDYLKYDYKVPLSCYSTQFLPKQLFSKGCADAVTSWMWDQLPIIASVLGCILFIEIFGVIASLVLGVAISHSSRAEYYEKL